MGGQIVESWDLNKANSSEIIPALELVMLQQKHGISPLNGSVVGKMTTTRARSLITTLTRSSSVVFQICFLYWGGGYETRRSYWTMAVSNLPWGIWRQAWRLPEPIAPVQLPCAAGRTLNGGEAATISYVLSVSQRPAD